MKNQKLIDVLLAAWPGLDVEAMLECFLPTAEPLHLPCAFKWKMPMAVCR